MKWIPPFGAKSADEKYTNAEPTRAGSNPDADFFNTVLSELLAVITAAGMTPDDSKNQLAAAIQYLADMAATSGVIKGAFWFGKTTAAFVPPNPTIAGQNYIDFTTLKTYTAKNDLSGWDETGALVKPGDIDFTILITSKFWDIPEQEGQQGGDAVYSHQSDTWAWWPKIISFKDANLTGTSTAPTPTTASPDEQIANKLYADARQNTQDITASTERVKFTNTQSIYVVALGNSAKTITVDMSGIVVEQNKAKTFEIHLVCGSNIPEVSWAGLDAWLVDSDTQPSEENTTAIFAVRVQNIAGVKRVIANYGGAY